MNHDTDQCAAISKALGAPQPLTALWEYLRGRRLAGSAPAELLAELERARAASARAGRPQDEDLILEGMDFLVGWCSPRLRLDEAMGGPNLES
ncbi:MAG TPA: hypothetical protein VGE07_06585 [Herpetosiphonaceae bacterium]